MCEILFCCRGHFRLQLWIYVLLFRKSVSSNVSPISKVTECFSLLINNNIFDHSVMWSFFPTMPPFLAVALKPSVLFNAFVAQQLAFPTPDDSIASKIWLYVTDSGGSWEFYIRGGWGGQRSVKNSSQCGRAGPPLLTVCKCPGWVWS